MKKLKLGTIPRLFLCVYLELMNITVDDLELTPFRNVHEFNTKYMYVAFTRFQQF